MTIDEHKDYETLEKSLSNYLNKATFTPYMVPFWVEHIMALVKAWAEEEKKKEDHEVSG